MTTVCISDILNISPSAGVTYVPYVFFLSLFPMFCLRNLICVLRTTEPLAPPRDKKFPTPGYLTLSSQYLSQKYLNLLHPPYVPYNFQPVLIWLVLGSSHILKLRYPSHQLISIFPKFKYLQTSGTSPYSSISTESLFFGCTWMSVCASLVCLMSY